MAQIPENSQIVTLLLGQEWLAEIKSPKLKAFSTMHLLLEHLFTNNDNDAIRFQLVLPSEQLQAVIDKKIPELEKVHSIDIYYNSATALLQDIEYHNNKNDKINALLTSGLMERLKSMNTSSDASQRATKPKQSKTKKKPKKKNYVSSVTSNPDILCRRCSAVIHDPFQLQCGHRQCKICIDKQDRDVIRCVECFEISSRDEVWFDRGFQRTISELQEVTLLNET